MAIEDFKRIVESLQLAVVIADAKGEVVFANAASAELLAREARSVQGTAFEGLFAEGERKRVAKALARVAEGKAGSSILEVRLAAGQDPARWVQLALQPARDARDMPAGVIAVLRDVGAERETEQALNLAAARLLALAEACPTAVMIENAAGEIELANEAFCALLALDSAPQSLAGLPALDTVERSPLVDAAELARLRRRPAQAGTLALRLADGGTLSLERQPIVVEQLAAGAAWSTHEDAGDGRAPRRAPRRSR